MPATFDPVMLVLCLLVVLLGIGLAWVWRDRARLARSGNEALGRVHDDLQVVLSASGEQFWELDLDRSRLRRLHMQIAGDGTGRLVVESDVPADGVVHPDDAARVRECLVACLKGDAVRFTSDHRVRKAGNQWRAMHVSGQVIERGPDGRARRMGGTARPVEENGSDGKPVAALPVLELQQNLSESVCLLDTDFRFLSANPAFTRITGYEEQDVLGHPSSLLDSTEHDAQFYTDIHDAARAGRWSGEVWQRRKDGEEFLSSYTLFPVRAGTGEPATFVAIFSDITHQRRAEQELRYLANFDALTNLPNRALLSEKLARAVVRARRQNESLAVLFIDFDHFKDINDSLGHTAGDRILRSAAKRLQDTVGLDQAVARLGGDEFTVLAEGISTADDADRIAREIIMAFEAPLLLDDRLEVSISPSIGISLYPAHGQVPTELLKRADTAMYQAKAAGRRTFVRYDDSMETATKERATLAAALRKVLDRGELRLVFQPRLSLPRRRIVGMEALLRWNSSEHGEVSPAQFIPIAEETGLILELGEWVLREACLALRHWQQSGIGRMAISVNVSALQLLRGNLPVVVDRVLAETGLPAELLEIELTESVIMANAEQTAQTLHAFRRSGVSLAIDDFGTGYSSLAYLRRLPITTLKIDKEFIGDLSNDPDDASITTTVIAMAHSLGLNVVAEGVETGEQLEFLASRGCDEIQGYWLSPPLEADRCVDFLRTWRLPADIPLAAAAPLDHPQHRA